MATDSHSSQRPPVRLVMPAEIKAPVQRAELIHGVREDDFTTMRFMVQASGNFDDILTIDIDDHNGQGASRLTVRGNYEALEIPGQLRWIANVLAQHKGDKSRANREHVTYEKSSVGAGIQNRRWHQGETP